MRRLVLILFATASISAFAADTAVKGYLMDIACSARTARKAGSAVSHTKACLRTPPCEESGYAVLTNDNQVIRFDHDGNERAKKFLADMAKDDNIKVTVTGAVNGDKMTVSKIELD
ncbi:MAG TPA: hypothetical protein VNV88_04805 [Candidatus Solibacter sp.]|jgi:hypothetical protein|nr:hypothetical protein [Candidatus Solibacter sp.]